MFQRLSHWWHSQREAWALQGIATGSFLSLVGISVLLLWPGDTNPTSKTLSKEGQERLSKRAQELAPMLTRFAIDLSARTAQLDGVEDLQAIAAYSSWVVEGSDRFTREFEAEVSAVAAKEGVRAGEVRRFFAARLQDATGRSIPSPLSVMPAATRGYLLAAPRLVIGPPMTVEEAMEAAIQKLIAKLPSLPSQGQEGLKKAILALRKALVAFDTKPIELGFTAPAEGAVVNFIPAISFEMTDTGSGPDPASRKLIALNTGPIVQQTTDLMAFTNVEVNDPVIGKAIVQAVGIPEAAIQDGLIDLQASGTDFAGNPLTSATRHFVLDRHGPSIVVASPTAVVASSPAAVSAVVTDLVSGVQTASIKVTLNGLDVTANLTLSVAPTTPLAAAQSVSISGSLQVQTVTNTLTISAADVAGNSAQATVSFVLEGGAPIVVEPGLAVVLEKLGGDNQSGFAGRCATEPLKVRVRRTSGSPVEGVAVQFNLANGQGSIERASGFSTTSNSQGIVAVVYRFGSQDEAITVTAVNAETIESVTFSEHGVPVDLMLGFGQIDGGTLEPGVNALTGGDLPGSALPEVMQFFGPAGATVKVDVVDAQGVAVDDAASIGRFVPDGAVMTSFDGGSFGTTRFMFVLSKNAPVGPIYLKFSLPQFRDAEGKPISKVVKSEVQSPDTAPARIVSGQGQVGRPGQALVEKLVAELVPQNSPGSDSLFFAILPSGPISNVLLSPGSFQVDEGVQHQFIDLFGPNTGVIVKVGSDKKAAVTYTMGTDPGPIRVVVSPSTLSSGPTIPPPVGEVFAVGPVELKLARRVLKRDPDGLLARDTQEDFIVLKGEGGQDRFESIRVPDFVGTEFIRTDGAVLRSTGPRPEIMVEARLPLNVSSVTAILRSFDRCGESLSIPNGLAPSVLTLTLEKKESIPGGFVYRSKEIVATSERQSEGFPFVDPVLPDGELLIEAEPGGSLIPSLPGFPTEGAELPGPSESFAGPQTVLILLDGGRREVLTKAVMTGQLPKFFGKMFVDNSLKADKEPELVIATYPTVTMTNFASVIAGEYPTFTRFPGNEFVDRLGEKPGDNKVRTRHFAFFGGAIEKKGTLTLTWGGVELPLQKDLVLTYELKDKSQGLANDRLPGKDKLVTLYESIRNSSDVRSAVVFHMFSRGVDLEKDWQGIPKKVGYDDAFATLIKLLAGFSFEEVAIQEADKKAIEGARSLLARKDAERPGLIAVYILGPDTMNHLKGPGEGFANVIEELKLVDDKMEGFLDDLKKSKGGIDNVTFVLATDHGWTETKADEDNRVSAKELADIIDGAGRVTAREEKVLKSGVYNAVMGFNGATAYVYLKSGFGTDPDWATLPRWSEDIVPVAEAIRKANETDGSGLKGAIDLILVRNLKPDAPFGDIGRFMIYTGQFSNPKNIEDVPGADKRVDAARRLGRLTRKLVLSPPDIILLSKFDESLPVAQRFYFESQLARGDHGSMSAADGLVVFLAGSSGADGKARGDYLTILKTLRQPVTFEGAEQKILNTATVSHVIRKLLGSFGVGPEEP